MSSIGDERFAQMARVSWEEALMCSAQVGFLVDGEKLLYPSPVQASRQHTQLWLAASPDQAVRLIFRELGPGEDLSKMREVLLALC